MKKYLSFIVLAFLISTGVASAQALDNGPIFGQDIVFPKNGSIAPSSHSASSNSGLPTSNNTSTGLPSGMGGIGNADSCAVVTSYNMYGSRSASVAQVQTLLNTHMNAGLPVTGFYGARTLAAIKAFQRSQGIAETGRQHALTTAALNKIACGEGKTLSTVMKRGYRGPAVVKLQQFLNAQGYHGYPVPVTGFYGPRTEAAVKAFQVAQGLPASGKAWTRTIAAINNVIASGSVAIGGKEGTISAGMPEMTVDPVATGETKESPSVTVTDNSKTQQAAVSDSNLFNASTLPWILLALAAGFGYIYGPWRKKEDEVATPTPTTKV